MLQVNTVKERLLFLSPVVQAGWEKEATVADFEKMAELGQGAFGLVSKQKHKKSQIIYAIKQMEKKRLKLSGMIEQIRTEIKIMYSLNHENIVKLFNHFEDDDYIYLVIDYAPGGQLWDKMQKTPGKRLPEKESAQYVKDLVSSLEYLHGKGIIHRDIKPENLLIDNKGHLKLADFGWSNYFKSDAQRTTFCGTLDYLAPEMLESGHQHDHMVDIWAIGVLIYELLTGKSPFSPTNPTLKMKDIERGTQQNIVAVTYDIPKEFPPLAKDLVTKILRKNPRTRLNLSEIKSHPWVKCTAFVVKKKELDPQALIDAITFGQNMADSKKFAQVDGTNYGFKPAFTEEEIIQYARPDSMLDKAQYGFTAATKTLNLDKQIAEFRMQLGITGSGNNSNNTTASKIDLLGLTPTSTTNAHGYNATSFSAISEEASPTAAKDLEYKLRIKTDECTLLQQEVEKLRRTHDSHGHDRVRSLEEENSSLRNQVSDLYKRISEKETAIGNYSQGEDLRVKIIKLEEQLTREKQYYESRISELEKKVVQSGGMSPVYSTDSNSGKLKEVQEENSNLNAQISEYTKLIGRLYENSLFDSDTEKKRMLEDIKTLRSLSSIKQDRIERLEAKMKSSTGY